MSDDMKTLFPGLYSLAMIYLPIVATSVPSEGFFSQKPDLQLLRREIGYRHQVVKIIIFEFYFEDFKLLFFFNF